MRMQNWAMALMSLLGPLVVCSTSFAQPAPGFSSNPGNGFVDNGGYPNPYTAQTPMNPGVFQPQFGTPGPQGGPPGSMPWPAVSPHLGPNVMQSQTFQQDGAWVNRIINRDREWYFTTEYLHTDFPGPGGNRIGSRVAPLDRITGEPPVDTLTWDRTVPPTAPPGGGTGTGGGTGGTGVSPTWTGPGAWPEVIQRSNLTTTTLVITPNNLFPVVRTTNILDNVLSSNGLRFRGGYFDNDGTGIGAEMWWGFTSNDTVQFGDDHFNGIPITQSLILGFDATTLLPSDIPIPVQADYLLNARVGYLPLEDSSGVWNDGVLGGVVLFPGTFQTGLTGATQRYDLLYKVATHMNAGGGNLNFFLGDVYRRPHAKIKSYVGAKYMFIDDRFGFRGLDSGFGYDVDTGGGTGGGTGGAPTFAPVNQLTGPLYPLFESILNSTVESHLAGPELGLRGDLGGGGFFGLWWQASAGLLVNHEKARVQGNNIGNAYYYNAQDPLALGSLLGPAYDMFANDTSFNDVEQHTHVSPILNLGVNAELGIFDAIPGLRKMSIFDDAKLNVGYNLTFIGRVASSADSIRWQGFPDSPESQIDYRTFRMQQLSIGLQFEH